mgnify:CR=1 FL=1
MIIKLQLQVIALLEKLLTMMKKREYIIIHHTGGSDADPYADTSHHTVSMVDSWHKKIGFNKSKLGYYVGYHYFIEKDGKVTQCRMHDETGCHCFTESCEILTDKGWKKIKDVTKSDYIADVKNNIEIEFNKPLDIVKSKTNNTMTVKNNCLDIEATAGHEFLVKSAWQKNYNKKTFSSFFKKNNQVIPCSAKYQNTTEFFEDSFLKLCIAIICDGSLVKSSSKKNVYKGFSFRFKKERKIKEIKKLIEENGLEYHLYKYKDGAQSVRVFSVDFISKFIKLFPNKQLDWWLLNVSKEQRDLILDSYVFWDGHSPKKYSYRIVSSISKKNIDILQAMAAISGDKRAIITECEPNRYEGSYPNGKILYTLSIVKKATVQINKNSYGVKNYDKEINVFCVTTKNHNILVRNNGKVFVAGNCVGQNDKIGICLAGNFDATLPTNEQIASTVKLLKELKQPNTKIVPHRKFAPHKTCYGSKLADNYWDEAMKYWN